MDPDGVRHLRFPGREVRVPKGWDRYTDRLLAAFPDEADGLGRCLDRSRPSPASCATSTAKSKHRPPRFPFGGKVVTWACAR
jgi:hypothetical protein